MTDENKPAVLQPGMILLAKLSAIVVHAEEMLSPGGHPHDKMVLESMLNDQEVQDWIKGMKALALAPVKRQRNT